MAQRGRPGLTPEQKRELWSRWKSGESLSEIGRAQTGRLDPRRRGVQWRVRAGDAMSLAAGAVADRA